VETGESQPWPAGEWQLLLAGVITRAGELGELAGVDPAAGGGPSAAAAEHQFAVRVPRGFAERIRLVREVAGAPSKLAVELRDEG